MIYIPLDICMYILGPHMFEKISSLLNKNNNFRQNCFLNFLNLVESYDRMN